MTDEEDRQQMKNEYNLGVWERLGLRGTFIDLILIYLLAER